MAKSFYCGRSCPFGWCQNERDVGGDRYAAKIVRFHSETVRILVLYVMVRTYVSYGSVMRYNVLLCSRIFHKMQVLTKTGFGQMNLLDLLFFAHPYERSFL